MAQSLLKAFRRRAANLVKDSLELVKIDGPVAVSIAQPHNIGNDTLAHGTSHGLKQGTHLVLFQFTRTVFVDGLKLFTQVFVGELNIALSLQNIEDLLPLDAECQLAVGIESGLFEELVERDRCVDGLENAENGGLCLDKSHT